MLGFGIVGISPAQAATFSYTGNTTGAPTWNRPNQNGPSAPTSIRTINLIPYSTFNFTVDTTESYSLSVNGTTTGFDTYAVLYQGSFNAATPLLNALEADDDDGPGNNSLITRSLTAGTNYFLVTTGFNNGDFGTFSNTITGATGTVTPTTAVPEPFTIIGTLVGGTAAFRMRKKLAQRDKA